MAKATKTKKEVSVDRRTKERRLAADRRTKSEADRRTKSETVKIERRKIERREKVNRRRQIDPTTCERDYTVDEIAFMQALDEYKRQNGRMFPTCSEILEVIRDLGYVKLDAGQLPSGADAPENATTNVAETDDAIQESQDHDNGELS